MVDVAPAHAASAERDPKSYASSARMGAWVLRLIIAALFLYAAAIKIDDPTKFAQDIRSYQVFSQTATNLMAYTIPWLELVVAILLVIGFWRREARLLIAGMLIAFTILKAIALSRGLPLDCGCFGDTMLAELSRGWNGVWLNLALLLALLGDVLLGKTSTTSTQPHVANVV